MSPNEDLLRKKNVSLKKKSPESKAKRNQEIKGHT